MRRRRSEVGSMTFHIYTTVNVNLQPRFIIVIVIKIKKKPY